MGRGYYTLTKVTDFGPYVVKVILPLGLTVCKKDVSPKSFSVYVERMDVKGEVLMLPKTWMSEEREPSRGYIPVEAAYPSDLAGNPVRKSDCVALEMAYGPNFPLSSCISAPGGMNEYIKQRYTVTQVRPISGKLSGKSTVVAGRVYDYPLGNLSPDTEGFHNVLAGEDALSIGYGYYIPQVQNAGARPLIVWLHGAGEGGTDPTVAYTANKVVAMIAPHAQAIFGGAYVLVPQAKTFWMDDGSGRYGKTGQSMYTEALKNCIDAFVMANPGIDRDRIYIGGDSNGGFMTMRMILDYPDYFAAAFPTCEALYEKTISDEKLNAIVHMPIWFTHSKNDPVVNPKETVLPTYNRLIAAGAKNVHFTFWDGIWDIHEGFTDAEGKPFEYGGHAAWIPVYNDDCRLDYDGRPVSANGREVSLFEWLSLQKKER